MNSISNNYTNVLKNMIFEQFSINLKKELNKNDNRNNIFNYIDLLSSLDETLCNIAKESLIAIFKAIDTSFCLSKERRNKYHIKAHCSRTILTIFGEITFTRTVYISKLNNASYCFLDRYLGLEKYDYFDPYIKAFIIEKASFNSIPTVCKMINDLIGNRISIEQKQQFLSRQTIRNILLKQVSSIEKIQQVETPETLHIMLDEKWVHTQNNNGKDVMVKSIVTFEETIEGNLINKHVFADFEESITNNCLDFLCQYYDMEKIKNLFVMGDGAHWIKSAVYEFKTNPNVNPIFCLDKFHFKQAIHHICNNKDLELIISDYVISNNKKEFIKCCEELAISYPHRKDTITKKKEYILNQWQGILRLYENNLKCPMESQISHNIAYLFTSRPKGYSKKMLSIMLKLRLSYINKQNIKLLYLNNLNIQEPKIINENTLNLDYLNKDIDRKDYSTTNLFRSINNFII